MTHSRRANMEFLDEARDKFKQVVNPRKKATPFAAMIARRKAEADKAKKGGGGAQASDNHGSESGGTKERLSARIKALAAQRHFSVVDHSRRPLVASASSSSVNALTSSKTISGKDNSSAHPPHSTKPTTEQAMSKTALLSTEKSNVPPVAPPSPSKAGSSRGSSDTMSRQASLYRPLSSIGLLPEERLDHVDRLIWLGLTHQIDSNDDLHRKSAPTIARRFLRMSRQGRSQSSIILDGRDLADEDDSNKKDNHYKVKAKGGLSHISRWASKFRQQFTGSTASSGDNGTGYRLYRSTDHNNNPGSNAAPSSCLPFINHATDGKIVPTAGGGGGGGSSPYPLHHRPIDHKLDQDQSSSVDTNEMPDGRDRDRDVNENNNQLFSSSNNAGRRGLGLG